MSASLKSLPLPQPGRLEASAQLLDIEPGLYSVEIGCTEITRARDGLLLPCLRLDLVVAATPGGGRAYMSALADGTMIMPGADPAYLRVRGGKASVVLTIYKPAGSSAKPDVRVRLIGNPQQFASTIPWWSNSPAPQRLR